MKSQAELDLLRSKYPARLWFLASLLLIAIVFTVAAGFAYTQFNQNIIKNELGNQQRMTLIVDQLLSRYFYTLKFITQNTVIQPEFNPEKTQDDKNILYQAVDSIQATKIANDEKIFTLLTDPRHFIPLSNIQSNKNLSKNIYNWQLFKALPDKDASGQPIALERRNRARSILDTYEDIHYVFQMAPNGDLIFLEPYNTQKNITVFNYGFRDYLNLAKTYKETSISEGYISNDQNKTQIITVSNPILDKHGKVTGIFAASVSAATLRDKIFKTLKENMNIDDDTIFYLIDRHGHIVASSSGKDIYFPVSNHSDDSNDPGNLRNLGFFRLIEWENDMFEKGNLWQRKIASWNENSLQSYYRGQYKNLDGIDVIATFLPTNLGGHRMNWGILIETPVSQVLASVTYFKHVFYLTGIILGCILLCISIITVKNFSRLEGKVLQKEKEIVRVTSQVAHDIRSPLVALDLLLKNLSQVEEATRIIIHQSVERINDIANNLLIQYKQSSLTTQSDPTTPELVALMIDSIISEKRIQYSSKNINFIKEFQDEAYGIFSCLNRGEFKRAISNLINNAVESITDKGVVLLKLKKDMDSLKLFIIDNGCGIASQLIPKLLEGKANTGKSGTGLGLSYAINRFNAWGCHLNIESELEKGTIIKITMPQCKPAVWVMSNLKVLQESTIVVLDDDTSIHGVWDQRFNNTFEKEDNINIEHFSDPHQLIEWHKNNGHKITIYLIDYELLGFELNGIDIIEQLNIGNQSVLVTSHFEDETIRARSLALNLKTIPKSYSLYIPIEVISIKPDYIFIDDDELLGESWKIRAAIVGKKLAYFNKINDFIRVMDYYDKLTPIYIDSNLNDNVKGEIFAKALYEKKFENIYLSTGYSQAHFKHMPWIKKIIGKNPPF